MKRDTTKPASDVADAKLLGDWFDFTETDLRTKMRGFGGAQRIDRLHLALV